MTTEPDNLTKQFLKLSMTKQFEYKKMMTQYEQMNEDQRKEFVEVLLKHHFVSESHYQAMLKNCLID